jgi:hypothetical protein
VQVGAFCVREVAQVLKLGELAAKCLYRNAEMEFVGHQVQNIAVIGKLRWVRGVRDWRAERRKRREHRDWEVTYGSQLFSTGLSMTYGG